MSHLGLVNTLYESSKEIYKKEGLKGLLEKRREYKEAYPSLLEEFKYWLIGKLYRKKEMYLPFEDMEIKINLRDKGLSRHLYLFGYHEPWCTRIYKEFLERDMVVYDIGSNLGYYVLLAYPRIGKNGKIYAIEPFAPNFLLLTHTIDHNDFDDRLERFYTGFDEAEKERELFYTDKYNRTNFLAGNSEDSIMMSTVSFDKFSKDKKEPDLIRMDVEGFEYYIIRGMKEFLKTKKKCRIFMEVHPYQMACSDLNWKEPLETLLKSGFKPKFIVKEIGPKKEIPIEVEEDLFSSIEKHELGPSKSKHGFGLFMER